MSDQKTHECCEQFSPATKYEDMDKVIMEVTLEISSLWDCVWPESIEWIARNEVDIRGYCNDGLWVHPCGRTYDEGRHPENGDVESGVEFCECDLCKGLKLIMKSGKMIENKTRNISA